MSVKIVRVKETVDYNPELPLEEQVRGCKHVVVDYNPKDSLFPVFMQQFERVAKLGLSLQMNIKFLSNHTLDGYRAERYVEKLSMEINENELIKKMSDIYTSADKKLSELYEMCEVGNER